MSSIALGQTTLTFDDVSTLPQALILNGYGGYDWSNMYVADAAQLGYPYNVSGYEYGLKSGAYVAVNGYANPATVSSADGSESIKSVSGYFSGAWTSDDVVTIQGLVHGSVVQTFSAGLVEAKPTFLHYTFLQNVDTIEFTTFSVSTPDSQFALDNMTVNGTPEPASLTVVGFGLTAFIKGRRRVAAKRTD